jgi:hypothetical protein
MRSPSLVVVLALVLCPFAHAAHEIDVAPGFVEGEFRLKLEASTGELRYLHQTVDLLRREEGIPFDARLHVRADLGAQGLRRAEAELGGMAAYRAYRDWDYGGDYDADITVLRVQPRYRDIELLGIREAVVVATAFDFDLNVNAEVAGVPLDFCGSVQFPALIVGSQEVAGREVGAVSVAGRIAACAGARLGQVGHLKAEVEASIQDSVQGKGGSSRVAGTLALEEIGQSKVSTYWRVERESAHARGRGTREIEGHFGGVQVSW